MQLTIKKLVFQALVEKAGAIVAGSCREMLPVLKNFHIEATSNGRPKLRVVATDLDLAVIAETEMIALEHAGESIVPAKKLIDMVKEAGDCDIILKTDDNIATITTPTTSWSIQLMKEKYPAIPKIESMQWTQMEAPPFAAGLKKVRNAISGDLDKRPELTLVKCGPTGLFATDGGRLHVSNVAVPIEFELPVLAVDDLARMMRGIQESTIRIAQTEAHILFEIANNVFIATKLQVKFPPIEHISNGIKNNQMELQVSREELVTAIKRARITADEETNRVTISLVEHSMVVETRDKMGATCRERLEVHWNHPPFKLSTNWQYLLQAITDMESPNIQILLGNDRGKQKAPIVLQEPNFYACINQLREETVAQ